jgi:hypothetical protein
VQIVHGERFVQMPGTRPGMASYGLDNDPRCQLCE